MQYVFPSYLLWATNTESHFSWESYNSLALSQNKRPSNNHCTDGNNEGALRDFFLHENESPKNPGITCYTLLNARTYWELPIPYTSSNAHISMICCGPHRKLCTGFIIIIISDKNQCIK